MDICQIQLAQPPRWPKAHAPVTSTWLVRLNYETMICYQVSKLQQALITLRAKDATSVIN